MRRPLNGSAQIAWLGALVAVLLAVPVLASALTCRDLGAVPFEKAFESEHERFAFSACRARRSSALLPRMVFSIA
jgi:hypothetical protein